MMNHLFPIFIFLSAIISIITNKTDTAAEALLNGGTEAIELSITLLGAICLWGGFMNIARASGLTKIISRVLSPLLCSLMPSLKSNSAAKEYVSMNVVSNLLGLGNAATPLGISAMRSLNDGRISDTATNDMITFVVLNTASIQLIPSTLSVLRSQAGSHTPLDILPCVWVSSLISVSVGIGICKIFSTERKKI